ncbi:MAG TPA: DNA cytosine methyltransferase [Pseudomonadota bacterium]|nr:DNA cytosine methyltransferase [Pseudomonadota bacterium]
MEFFAGSGLVAEGLRNHFRAVWANDQCPKKAAVYTANHGSEGFHLGSIADVEGSQLPACPLAWASFAHNIGLLSRKHRALLEQLPPHDRFVAPGYKRTRQGKQVLELRFDDLSGCLRTPEGGSSRQTLVIKTKDGLQSRLITIREAARLMGAPDSYRFLGSYNDQYKALGDAVAVPVSQWLAEHLLSPLVQSHNLAKRHYQVHALMRMM